MKAQNEVKVLHQGQALIKATNPLEVGRTAEQRLIAEEAAQAPATAQHKTHLGQGTFTSAAMMGPGVALADLHAHAAALGA